MNGSATHPRRTAHTTALSIHRTYASFVPEVRLVDLPVIKRYSLVVRQDAVDARRLFDDLEASLDVVEAVLLAAQPAPRTKKAVKKSAKKAAAKRPAKTTAKKR